MLVRYPRPPLLLPFPSPTHFRPRFRLCFGEGDLGDITAEESMFRIFENFPATTLLSVLGIILVAIFFITSSDSGSLVVDMLASGGHPNPPIWPRVLRSEERRVGRGGRAPMGR